MLYKSTTFFLNILRILVIVPIFQLTLALNCDIVVMLGWLWVSLLFAASKMCFLPSLSNFTWMTGENGHKLSLQRIDAFPLPWYNSDVIF